MCVLVQNINIVIQVKPIFFELRNSAFTTLVAEMYMDNVRLILSGHRHAWTMSCGLCPVMCHMEICQSDLSNIMGISPRTSSRPNVRGPVLSIEG